MRVFLRLCLFLLIFQTFLAEFSKRGGLYSPTDDVISFNNVTFYSNLLHKDNAWIIEFYNSWCGHCVNFAPTWKKIATDVKGWQRVLSVGALDCSVVSNMPICRKFDIKGYPTMKLFYPDTARNETGLDKVGSHEFSGVKEVIINFISDGKSFKPPPSWPKLQPLKSIEKIWPEAKANHEFVVLIFEDEKSVIGREVILDTMDFPHILVRRMLKQSVTKYGIKQFPSLYAINKDGTYKKLAVGEDSENDRGTFVKLIVELSGGWDRKKSVPRNIGHGTRDGNIRNSLQNQELDVGAKTKEIAVVSEKPEVHMQDLESALHYCFRQEIAIRKNIEGDDLDALKSFVGILVKYFPGREPVKKFLQKVMNWLSQVTSSLTGEDWVQNIDQLQDDTANLPDKIEWVCCRGSKPRFRGYPCSMWTLFHTLTVNSYISEQGSSTSPTEVLLAIRGYMKRFFGCQECSVNFYKMAATLEAEVLSVEDSILWLWSAHNKANKRLHGNPTEDPDFPKVQFPVQNTCPACHTKDSKPGNPTWKKSEVFKFLVNLYKKSSIVQDVENKAQHAVRQGGGNFTAIEELDWWEKKQRAQDLHKIHILREQKKLQLQQKKVNILHSVYRLAQRDVRQPSFKIRPLRTGWGLSQIDLGMCMLFYVVCALIILLMYYHFTVRRNWRPCGFLPV